MAYYNGKNLILKMDGTTIGACKECSVQIDADTQEVSSPDTGEYKEYITKRKSWSVSASGLILSGINYYTALLGTTATITLTLNGETLTGSTIVKSVQMTGSVKKLATYSIKLQGTGTLA